MRRNDAALVATGVVLAAAIAGSRYRPTPDQPRNAVWYGRLDKPSYRPSGPTIGIAWTILDGMLCYVGTRLLSAPPRPARTAALAGWGTAVAGIPVYQKLMFGQHRLGAALGAVGGMLAATLTAVGAAATFDRRAAGALVPLVAWLGFAGLLQEELWRRND